MKVKKVGKHLIKSYNEWAKYIYEWCNKNFKK